ncbi:flagellar brake protein [Cohnella nanjingensis]|uniref:PilZ domain-containing protein n=1 Tax=Cohnella nanjingensis TaxID=1387779 RepID=A0A7X0VHI1_9BACL|nr:PilZ domain-containing protein [Cohnella nanjingensis]MBB6674170.1 PilZ domain-containing protein [Cohnella nanjingensis]
MLPNINQTLYIQILTPDADASAATTLRSRLADADEPSLYFEIPIDEKSGRLQRLQTGEELRLTYFTSDGVKHQFVTSVVGFRQEAVNLVAVRKPAPEDISREQRRSFLRVEAQLEVAVRFGEKLRFTALTDDVGGGGLSFRCERKWPITPNTKIHCWLLLSYRSGSVSHAQFEGEVVRVVPVEPNHHLVMMRFEDIQDADQQKIIRFCFERQLDMRKD